MKTLFKLVYVFFTSIVIMFAGANITFAQTYPGKPISLVVPYPPGGASDVVARLVGQKLSEIYGQPVIIENKPGANGNIALEMVARANPDGYTLLMGNVGPNAINAGLYNKLRFDPIKSFSPITLTSAVPIILVANPSVPAKNAKELIAYIKANPGKLNFATGGIGSATHLTAEMFKSMAGLDIVAIPYKGDMPALTDVIGGKDVTLTFATSIAAMPLIKSGKVRALGIASLQRSPSLPDIPTISESGLPGFESTSWGGILAPAGTPHAVISSLHNEIVKILGMPEVKMKISTLGAETIESTPEEFAAYLKSEISKWSKIIKISGATAE
jgi:tripartite-type tricarboxylate transporter receptor subunit TctC